MKIEEKIEALLERVQKLELTLQTIEQRLTDLENGEFGTGIYLDGCSEADAEYIIGKQIKKAGEWWKRIIKMKK